MKKLFLLVGLLGVLGQEVQAQQQPVVSNVQVSATSLLRCAARNVHGPSSYHAYDPLGFRCARGL